MSLSSSLVTLTNDLRAAVVGIFDAAGNQLSGFDATRPANATIATVPVTTTDAVLLAANPDRRGVVLTNEASKTLYVAFGAVASATAYTYPVPSGQTKEFPLNGFTGAIHGVLSAGTGNVRITEITT